MLLAGMLTLVVPLVGWQSVKQLYAALQQTRIDEQTLKVANMRLALVEADSVNTALEPGAHQPKAHDWYAQLSRYPLFLDGYADDWQTLLTPALLYENRVPMELPRVIDPLDSAQAPASGSDAVVVRTANANGMLYLFFAIQDKQVVYHELPILRADAGETEQPDRWTTLVNGDSVELLIKDPAGQSIHGVFRALAPGSVSALSASDERLPNGGYQRAGKTIESWQAHWQESNTGYQLEVRVPLPANGAAFGFSVVDIDVRGEPETRWTGSTSPQALTLAHSQNQPSAPMPRVYRSSENAESRLRGWTTDGVRARLFDVHGRLLSDVNELYSRDTQSDEAEAEASSGKGILNALLFRLFSLLVAGDLPLLPETRTGGVSLHLSAERRATVIGDQPVTSRYVTEENDRVLGTLAPIGGELRRGYLLIEANEEHASAYAGSQLARLFSLLLLVSLLAGCGLLVFAVVLSSRIRRLSHEAQHAISLDGRVQGLVSSDARDEIGDLSRKLSSLLSRSAAYTQHLEALSSRLSHELRTPLSVVRTSIENIDTHPLNDESRLLLQRASHGAERLAKIIKALVDSTRIEQSILNADKQLVDLHTLLPAMADMYRQVYPQTQILLRPEPLPALQIVASAELLEQAMDKLVANAIGFNRGEQIVLQLTLDDSTADHVMICVANQGSLPEGQDTSQLFDPLISVRDSEYEELHLGLGLYIVRLVAEHCGGDVFANEQDGWVVVGLSVPLHSR